MKKFSEFVCKNKKMVIIVSLVFLIFSIIGINLTKINYDILIYLPEDIETIKGQEILADEFNMGSYSIAVIDEMNPRDILNLENRIKNIDGVANVVSLYDAIGVSIPIEALPSEITSKLYQDGSNLLFITFNKSTSSKETIEAIQEIRNITDNRTNLGGMSSMILDTMELSEKEIAVYIAIAVILCIVVLELFLDSYIVPFILLANIGCAILFNLGTNIFLGQISYITKALVAVLQLGVTTDFSIFLYHSYESKKAKCSTKEEAMVKAIKETFTSVTGSSLTTIVGFLALCAMQLTLGFDLGIVMAKGVLLGVLTVLSLFPSLLLVFDKMIEKTKHKQIVPNFSKLNNFIINHHVAIFILFIITFIPTYLAYSKVEVYYKLDSSLPDTLESVKTNNALKENYNIVSPEIIIVDKNLKNDDLNNMINEISSLKGIDFVLSFSKLKQMGLTENMISEDLLKIFENENYQMFLLNSTYDIATDELNNQIEIVNNIVKKYDDKAIVAGEGPLMKDLIKISNADFKNVNTYSIVCIFIVLFIVLKSISLPFLLIIAIEFAIFANMGISYFSGDTLPFIASIVLGTIQLGATIDYAILMTTNYLDRRRKGKDKKEAMLEVMNYCGVSILISGMCFFAATFGVGVYSNIEMIGSLCALISRGALISMIVVITILPSILLIFDKLILKTTVNSKEKKMKNIKKLSKQLTIWGLVSGILITTCPIPIYALTKNETVYSKLNSDGSVKNVIVNEQLLNTSKLDVLEDYTELKNIINVSNDSKYELNENKLTWTANGKDIFYQGVLEKNLPVSVNVTYKLNDVEMPLEEIIGKSGKVSIILKYTNNDKHGSLYTPFVVTTGMIIDSENNTNISVLNGKVINNGNKSIVVGLATPGLYESLNLKELKDLDTIIINYETNCFELSSIYSIITPKLIESNDLKIFNKLDNIYKNTNELKQNMDIIQNGANKLSNGSLLLKNNLKKAIDNLTNTESTLTSEQISKIQTLAVDGIKAVYTDSYEEQIANTAWNQVKNNLSSNDENVIKYINNSVSQAVSEYLKSVNKYDDYMTCEIGKVSLEQIGFMSEEQMNSCNIIKSDSVLPLIKQAAITSAKEAASSIANYTAENVSKSVAVSVSKQTAIETSANVSAKIANEVNSSSIKAISDSLNALYAGVNELDNGIINLSNGITKFNNEGISKITELVNSSLKNRTDKIKALVKLGEDYKLFNSKLNNETETKIIMVIDSKKVEQKNLNNEVNEAKTTFWDRVKNLFK